MANTNTVRSRAYRGAHRFQEDVDFDDPRVRQQVDPSTPLNEPLPPDTPLETDAITGNVIVEDKPPTVEDANWKKRYGDLRSHLTNKEKEWNQRISALEAQLEEASRKELKLPKTQEELEAWKKQFPDVAAIVETIAMQKIAEQRAEVSRGLQSVEEMRRQNERERAENKIRSKHSDFDDLRNDQDFHDWAASQPKLIRDALYENDSDADSVIRVIDLYKMETKKPAPKTTIDNKQAASLVTNKQVRSEPAANAEGQNRWSESRVRALSQREYAKYEDEIDNAMLKGQFDYDLTGAVR